MKKRRRIAPALFCCQKPILLERRRTWGTSSGVSTTTVSQLFARTRPHLVELYLLLGIQQPLDLRMSAVAHDSGGHSDRIQLRSDGFVERDDLTMLLLDERIDRSLLLRRELELLRHLLSVGARPAHFAAVSFTDCTIGREAERTTRQKGAQQKHQCVPLGAIHLNPQCDKT